MDHPIVAAVGSVRSTLKSIGDANPTFMTTDDKAAALTELVRAEGQLAELRLRILADAGDLAADRRCPALQSSTIVCTTGDTGSSARREAPSPSTCADRSAPQSPSSVHLVRRASSVPPASTS